MVQPVLPCSLVNPYFKVQVLEEQSMICIFAVFSVNPHPTPPPPREAKLGVTCFERSFLTYSLPTNSQASLTRIPNLLPGKA